MQIENRMERKGKPWAFVVCTDSFMSGWGGASNGRSIYALAVYSPKEADTVMDNAGHRTDMLRPRIVKVACLADGGGFRPLTRLREGDHLAIVDDATAARWYRVDGFKGVGYAKA